MDKTNPILRFSGLALLSALLGACSSEAPLVSPTMPPAPPSHRLQERPLEVGQTRIFDQGAFRSCTLTMNTNDQVASVSITDGKLSVTGLAYGTTLISVRDTLTDRSRSYEFFITGTRPEMPTELFASHNVAPDGEHFVTTQDPVASGFFSFAEAQAIHVDGYRLPTSLEYRALFPYNALYNYGQGGHFTYTERITLSGVTKRYDETFISTGKHVGYALRFGKSKRVGEGYATDNSLLTAFRYEYSRNEEDPRGGYSMKITTRYLGEQFHGDISMIASEGFWASFRWDDHTLVLPAAGIRELHGLPIQLGVVGEYWSSSKGYDDLSATAMGFGKNDASHTIHADRIMARTVRLIKAQ
jgi:lipoprotein